MSFYFNQICALSDAISSDAAVLKGIPLPQVSKGWTAGYMMEFFTSEFAIVPSAFSTTERYRTNPVSNERPFQRYNDNWEGQMFKDMPMLAKFKQTLCTEGLSSINGILGPTGSGKTLGVVAGLMEHHAGHPLRILVVLPTKLAVEHSYTTLMQTYKHLNQNLFGSITSKKSILQVNDTVTVFVTVGIAQILVQNRAEFSYIFLDEVHKRPLAVQYLLSTFKELGGVPVANLFLNDTIPLNTMPEKRCRYLVASANEGTIEDLKEYFGAMQMIKCSHDQRRHPLNTIFVPTLYNECGPQLSNVKCTNRLLNKLAYASHNTPLPEEHKVVDIQKDKIAFDIVRWLCEGEISGDILIFVTGAKQMSRLRNNIKQNLPGAHDGGFIDVFELHGQHQIDEKLWDFDPSSVRTKIIICTDFAETSVTIKNIGYVVDTLERNQSSPFDKWGFFSLTPKQIDALAAEQRCGRTGRTRSGFYFPLSSKKTYEEIKKSNGQPESEFETPSSHLCRLLDIGIDINKVHDGYPKKFYFNPITKRTFDEATEYLMASGFIFKNGNEFGLTETGRVASRLVLLEPELAMAIYAGATFGTYNTMITMAANLSLRYSVIISNRSMRVRTYFNLNIENYNASAHSEHKLVAMGYEHGKTCYSNITRRHSSEHGKDDYEREKMDFNKLFNVKLLNQVEDIYRRVVLSSCRINLHRSAESNSTRDSDPVAILLSLTVAFGNRCGIPIYGFDRSGRDAATPHFINADSYEFWAESSFTNHYAKANNMVGIYFEMQKFADARPHGPVTIIPPFFFCCFSCPWMNAEYIDGNLCFFGTLKFSMDKEHANVVFQIRGLLSKLLQKSGIDFNGKTKLVNDIYKLATLVEAYRPSSIVPIPIEPLPPVNSAQH